MHLDAHEHAREGGGPEPGSVNAYNAAGQANRFQRGPLYPSTPS